MAKTVVVLGAAYTGVPIAHYLLKHTAAKVKGELKVVLVSPNSDFYWHNATVRGILPGQIPNEKLFYPIVPSFSKYPTEQFDFILGKAQAVDPASDSVTIRKNDGFEMTIKYDDLVIATGSTYNDGVPFKDMSSTEETKAALDEWRKRIDSAKSIVLAGGGTTGVEVAAELGEEYASRRLKEVTYIVASELPLGPTIMTDVRETVKKDLERLKVNVLFNTKVLSTKQSKGKTFVELSGGKKTLEADLYIPVLGATPNTSFLPRDMLDDAGFVKQAASLLVDKKHNIYVVGDAGNLEESRGYLADLQVQHLAKVLDAKLSGEPHPGEYKVDPKMAIGVSLGKSRGTGQMGTWKVWSLIIWWFKCRHLGIPMAQAFVDGLRTVSAEKW
ncbi:putative FAD binding protein [Podospora aff. communis PSN243]|uniref:FAD binding protein n=1 Tax=Podospora aff. communis PSN243 TaxID=3040156 RepID=A0AAV9GY20_9PEZI|nr:putative FAD binding protein [Podospora aff. communis PSN243]